MPVTIRMLPSTVVNTCAPIRMLGFAPSTAGAQPKIVFIRMPNRAKLSVKRLAATFPNQPRVWRKSVARREGASLQLAPTQTPAVQKAPAANIASSGNFCTALRMAPMDVRSW